MGSKELVRETVDSREKPREARFHPARRACMQFELSEPNHRGFVGKNPVGEAVAGQTLAFRSNDGANATPLHSGQGTMLETIS
jgi:hypothetical protein